MPILPFLAAVAITIGTLTITIPLCASAEIMTLLQAEPRPSQVMSGSGIAFALHFDHPLDQGSSRFMLVGVDGAGRTVPVRLGAQPSVLSASVGRLAPGAYTLNWSARASNGASLGSRHGTGGIARLKVQTENASLTVSIS